MKESYGKGVSNHPGLGPCEGSREAALEALARGICGLGIPEVDELEIAKIMGADGVRLTGRQHGSVRQHREHVAALRSRRPYLP
jgi:hypothetical protein